MKNSFVFLICVFLILSNCLSQTWQSSSDDIFLKLQKLKVCGSVLYIGAHPDDENNTLLPYLAKERNYRTAYLSLTRGEGGQNLIGDEQGVDLGLIRTQELLAARRLDGAEQYFTRAYEFGYSKSWQETFQKWDIPKILFDMVWVIRQYQPDIIIKRFPGDTRAGHGHHAASAILADSAFILAADPNAFPEQIRFGLNPWKTKRIFWNTYNFGSINTTNPNQLKIQVNVFNPLLGKYYGELGAEARTMHKSQGEGRSRRRGEIFEYFSLTNGATYTNDLMDDVDITWSRFPNGKDIIPSINQAIQDFDFTNPNAILPSLLTIYHKISALPASAFKEVKLQETIDLIELCSGLFLEATTDNEAYTNGDSIDIKITATQKYNSKIKIIKLQIHEWDSDNLYTLEKNNPKEINAKFLVNDMAISQPYFLKKPIIHDSYQFADVFKTGNAEDHPVYNLEVWLTIDSFSLFIKKPVQYKYVDPVRGELYQPLVIKPHIEFNFVNKFNTYTSLKHLNHNIKYEILKNSNNNIGFQFEFSQDSNNHVLFSQSNTFHKTQVLTNTNLLYNNTLQVNPINQDYTQFQLVPSFIFDTLHHNLKSTAYTYKGVFYNHIPNIVYYKPAENPITFMPIQNNPQYRIGYIPGAGDDIKLALEELGYTVDVLTENDIFESNLTQYKAIILGIRASNIYPFLTEKNNIFNHYINHGGNLISQYIKSNLVNNKPIELGPYSFKINSSSRITNENAEVHFLQPNHSLFNHPNKIDVVDFNHWVQERSTYQAITDDPHFEKFIAMQDPNEPKSDGSLLLAQYGKGNFFYVSLVLFRQIPIGNKAAYKLLVNMIEYKR